MNPAIIQEIKEIKNPRKKFWVYLIIACILATFISLATKPLRFRWSEDYRTLGDNFLMQKQYLHANLAYKKALLLYGHNETAKGREGLAISGALSIEALMRLYQEKNDQPKLDQLKKAATPQENVNDQLRLARDFLENNEYQLAIIAAKTATRIDPSYRDAWLYLGIANFKAAQFLELTVSQQKEYLTRANNALFTAKKLDPEYPSTENYAQAIADGMKNLQL